MVLSFTVQDRQQQQHVFHIQGVVLESALDVANLIIAKDHTLITVCFIDQDGRINLPTEVFDGQPFMAPLCQLEQQWRQLLAQPLIL